MDTCEVRMSVGAVPRTVNRSLWAGAADKLRETDGSSASFPSSPFKYSRYSRISGQCDNWTNRCDMDDNENYYYCYDYYYDDDERDSRPDFPGRRCWEPVVEPVVLQDSAGQVAGGGLPVVEDHRGKQHYNIIVS